MLVPAPDPALTINVSTNEVIDGRMEVAYLLQAECSRVDHIRELLLGLLHLFEEAGSK